MSGPAPLTELGELRRQRRELAQRILSTRIHGTRRRRMIDRVHELTRRELMIEAGMLGVPSREQEERGLSWWQK